MWWRLLAGWLLIAVAFFVTTLVVPGIHVAGGPVGYLLVAAVFGLVNAILGPVLRFASLPLRILTLGLFSLVINAVLLVVVSKVVPELTLDGFLAAVVAALVLSIVSMVLNAVFHAATRVAT
jgi:putative membrane protein